MKAFVLNTLFLVFLLYNTKLIVTASQEDRDCPIECFHNGKCVLHEPSGQYHCQCPSLDDGSMGFQGIHCEESYIMCTDGKQKNWRCHNYGKCNLLSYGCDCPVEFSGSQFCETYVGPCNAENGDFLLGPECSSGGVNNEKTLSKLKATQSFNGGQIFGIFLLSTFGAALLFFSGMKMEQWRMRRKNAENASQSTMRNGGESEAVTTMNNNSGGEIEIT